MIDRGPLTAAVQDLLARATGRPCGLGELPLVDGEPAELPYAVLYPLGGTPAATPFVDSWAEATLTYQVTVVARRMDQAEWLADRVRRAVLQRTASGAWVNGLEASGLYVWARRQLADDGFDSESAKDCVVSGAQRFQFSVTG
ncbi:hypothetical protein GCM10010289_75990 [Streptomyces violascens]|uniref:Tail terminator n=1 Tax=Streptomyces violascens TaxID=67381 RepID=A0ABQ3QV67_9ACTN|nr:hypothetical protein GCM10010289_75990 [Streptomyces violascens]GHI41166.1 hypothetical protein Sviol_55740 [Streptomyces violascens]